MNQMTVKRYIALFEALFLVVALPPWSDNLGKRLAKTAKIYFNDAGLLAHLLGVDADGLAHQSVSKGRAGRELRRDGTDEARRKL